MRWNPSRLNGDLYARAELRPPFSRLDSHKTYITSLSLGYLSLGYLWIINSVWAITEGYDGWYIFCVFVCVQCTFICTFHYIFSLYARGQALCVFSGWSDKRAQEFVYVKEYKYIRKPSRIQPKYRDMNEYYIRCASGQMPVHWWPHSSPKTL